MLTRIALLPILLLGACTEETTPKQAEEAALEIKADAVKERQLSIEEAAEEATKLIEADAREEIDAAQAESAASN